MKNKKQRISPPKQPQAKKISEYKGRSTLTNRVSVTKGQHRTNSGNTNRQSYREIAEILNKNGRKGNHASVRNWLNSSWIELLFKCNKELDGVLTLEQVEDFINTSGLMDFENTLEEVLNKITENDPEFIQSLLPEPKDMLVRSSQASEHTDCGSTEGPRSLPNPKDAS